MRDVNRARSVVPHARVTPTPAHRHIPKPATSQVKLVSDGCCSTGRPIAMPTVAASDPRYASTKYLSEPAELAKSSNNPNPAAAVIALHKLMFRDRPRSCKLTASATATDTKIPMLILHKRITPMTKPVPNARRCLPGRYIQSSPNHNSTATAKMIQSWGWPTPLARPFRRKPTSRNATSAELNRPVHSHTTPAMSDAITIQTGSIAQRKLSWVTLTASKRASNAALKKVNGPYMEDTWS